MKNPIRRNRNIGTSKQGHGKNNFLVISDRSMDYKAFYERLGAYKKVRRIINGHEFEKDYYPAIIIEAISKKSKLRWSKKLSVDAQKELQRLREDGFEIKTGKRYHEAPYKLDSLIDDTDTISSNPLIAKWDILYDEYDRLKEVNEDLYNAIPKKEKEAFAHRYADEFRIKLKKAGLIPFPRMLNPILIEADGLNINDFV